MKNCKFSCLVILLGCCLEACLANPFESSSADICEGADPSKLEFFPVEGDCTRYIQCYDGQGTIFQCEDDLWWHQEIENCDYPGEYCVWGTPPTPGSTSTTTEGTIGSDPRCIDSGLHYWPHPAFCHRYIECFEGASYEMACPPSLYFSISHQECVNAEDSDCCAASDEC